MAFTYSASELSTPLNHLRFLVQDTIDDGHFFENEEIVFAAAQETNIYRVAAGLCRVAAAKFAQMPGHEAEIILKSEEKAKTYLTLAKNYDEKAVAFDDSLSSGDQGGMNFPMLSDQAPAFTRDLHFS